MSVGNAGHMQFWADRSKVNDPPVSGSVVSPGPAPSCDAHGPPLTRMTAAARKRAAPGTANTPVTPAAYNSGEKGGKASASRSAASRSKKAAATPNRDAA